ncbi:MAG: YeeE/YedE thiosulfate transporter family protein [Longimicrobiales bacterium]
MSGSLFPMVFATEELRLLTGLFFGFLFGFVLERAGFGNARKLAGQFYLHDMTVFKVMFTAILVAMVGLFSLSAMGLADLSMMWVNPTFLPAQAVGGFLLGVGFIMSGLCPGTSVVSMVSGRIDAWVTFAGIVVGIAVFTLTVDWVPGLLSLYRMGSGEVSLLHEVLGVPALVLILALVAGATLAFAGAEKVESFFQRTRDPAELTPAHRPGLKLVLGGGLAVVALLGLALSSSRPDLPPVQMASMTPRHLAEVLIERRPGIMILDLRADPEGAEGIPGAVPSSGAEDAGEVLKGAPPATTVVVYDEAGGITIAPAHWPRTLEYRFLDGGFSAWEAQVLTPWTPSGSSLEEREMILKQNQIAAFFSGAAVQASSVAAPPPAMPAGGVPPKKKSGGC